MPGITIQIMGDGEGAVEALRLIEEKMKETAERGDSMSAQLAEAGERIESALSMVGIGIGIQEVTDRLKEMVAGTIDAAVELGHLSQQTGINVEQLSSLKFLSEETGVSFEALTKGFKKLSTNVFELHQGSKQATESFGALHLSQRDVEAAGNDMLRVLELVADKFKDMPDGIQKNAIATQLFGRAGQELIPILNQGSEAIEEYAAKGRAMGIVFDEEGIKKMEAVHQRIADLKAAYQGLSIELTDDLAPALKYVAERMMQALGHGPEVMQADRALSMTKNLPDDIAANPEQLGRFEASHKRGIESQLKDLEDAHRKGLESEAKYRQQKNDLQKQWDAADVRENQAYFATINDQIIEAQHVLATTTGGSAAWQKKQQDYLQGLFAKQAAVMDQIDAAHKRHPPSDDTPPPAAKAAAASVANSAADTKANWQETYHLMAGIVDQMHQMVADAHQLKWWEGFTKGDGQEEWDRMQADAQARIDEVMRSQPRPKVVLGQDQDEVSGANQLGPAKSHQFQMESAQEAQHVIGGFMDQLTEQALRGKVSFHDLVDSAIADIERWAMKILEERELLPALNSLFGITGVSTSGASSAASFGGESVGSFATAGLMAGGGELSGNDWAVVGDSPGGDMRNAELFAPKGPGTVLPHDVLEGIAKGGSGGGGSAPPNVRIVNVNNSSQPVDMKQGGASWDSQAREFVIHTVLEDAQSGGPMAAMMQGFSRT